MPSASHSESNPQSADKSKRSGDCSEQSIIWRVIPLETHDAFMNMALDEACCEAVGGIPFAEARDDASSSPISSALPTIRFYQWQPSAVSIGYFQSLEDEVALDRCKQSGVDVIRRRTGGGAVYHDFDGEITYSVIAPESLLPGGITESYHVICGWIVESLGEIGIESAFKPINDIIALRGANGEDGGSRKISGNAQTRRGGVVLQHGTILYDVDVKKMFSLLKVGQEKIADKLIAAVEDRVTCVRRLSSATKQQTYEGLLKGFTKGKKWEFGAWSDAELSRAKDLCVERYRTDVWNRMR